VSRPPTLLTDFDGVWTDPVREREAVRRAFEAALREVSGWRPARIEAVLERGRAELAAAPDRHGWRIGDALTSFVDEDVFALPTALGGQRGP